MRLVLLGSAALAACGLGQREARPAAGEPSLAPAVASAVRGAPAPPAPRALADDLCRKDADCGYDPDARRCGADARLNRQPPIVDQGLLCYCDDARRVCALLRVDPVPCEGDADCALDPAPREHPVRASAARPHERGKRCRDFTVATTCERTNICTLHRLECTR
jgi:hypothetical protein